MYIELNVIYVYTLSIVHDSNREYVILTLNINVYMC